jgi:hypothetical protein
MKQKARNIGLPALVLAPVLMIALAAIPRGDAVGQSLRNCTLDPDTVAIQEQPLSVTYTAPDSLGAINAVTAPEDSGIRVASINTESKSISLNTSSAAEGDWQLTLSAGEMKSCTANLTVRRADAGL